MHFLNPERLWLLVGVAALAVAYVGVLRWRRATTMRFTQVELLDRIVPQRPSWHRHVVATLQVLGLAAGVVAIARPVDTVTERIGSEGRIMLLFDVSSSMSASDVSPSRLAAAQQAAKDFIDQVDTTVEVGLITFSGAVSLDVRPTLERDPLTAAIDDIQLSDAHGDRRRAVGRHPGAGRPWPATAGHRPPMRPALPPVRRRGRSCC